MIQSNTWPKGTVKDLHKPNHEEGSLGSVRCYILPLSVMPVPVFTGVMLNLLQSLRRLQCSKSHPAQPVTLLQTLNIPW